MNGVTILVLIILAAASFATVLREWDGWLFGGDD